MTLYQVTRLYRDENQPSRLVAEDLTLEEAQAWCRRPDTHGDGWFDGYQAQPERAAEDEEICGDCYEFEADCRCAHWDAVAEDDQLERERGLTWQ